MTRNSRGGGGNLIEAAVKIKVVDNVWRKKWSCGLLRGRVGIFKTFDDSFSMFLYLQVLD